MSVEAAPTNSDLSVCPSLLRLVYRSSMRAPRSLRIPVSAHGNSGGVWSVRPMMAWVLRRLTCRAEVVRDRVCPDTRIERLDRCSHDYYTRPVSRGSVCMAVRRRRAVVEGLRTRSCWERKLTAVELRAGIRRAAFMSITGSSKDSWYLETITNFSICRALM